MDATIETGAASGGSEERDAKGRFGKGNRGGPGNPFTRQSARLRKAALEAATEDDSREIIAVLKAKARAGDVAAIKLLLSYTIGKPPSAVDPDTLDQHELETITSNHVSTFDGVEGIIQGMPVTAIGRVHHRLQTGGNRGNEG